MSTVKALEITTRWKEKGNLSRKLGEMRIQRARNVRARRGEHNLSGLGFDGLQKRVLQKEMDRCRRHAVHKQSVSQREYKYACK